jgi:ketosteroid isomerase-like protein
VKHRMIVIVAASLAASPALADPAADALSHSRAFERAVDAGDVPGVMALYADDARAVWPGEGAEAQGKPEIEKLIVETLKAFPGAKMSLESQDALPLGRGYIAVIGRWRMVVPVQAGKTKTLRIRTTEILRKQGARTLYFVDHAAVGLPPPPAGETKPQQSRRGPRGLSAFSRTTCSFPSERSR